MLLNKFQYAESNGSNQDIGGGGLRGVKEKKRGEAKEKH